MKFKSFIFRSIFILLSSTSIELCAQTPDVPQAVDPNLAVETVAPDISVSTIPALTGIEATIIPQITLAYKNAEGIHRLNPNAAPLPEDKDIAGIVAKAVKNQVQRQMNGDDIVPTPLQQHDRGNSDDISFSVESVGAALAAGLLGASSPDQAAHVLDYYKGEMFNEIETVLQAYAFAPAPVKGSLPGPLAFFGALFESTINKIPIASTLGPKQCLQYEWRIDDPCFSLKGNIKKAELAFQIFPSVQYHYPVDKVENYHVPFTTRYATKDFVNDIVDEVKNEYDATEFGESGIGIEKNLIVVRRDDAASSMEKINQELINKGLIKKPTGLQPIATPAFDLDLLGKIRGEDTNQSEKTNKLLDAATYHNRISENGRFVEYHAVPDVFSRQQVEVINSRRIKVPITLEIVAKLRVAVPPIIVFPRIRVMADEASPLCHELKEPRDLDSWDPEAHFFGSEFPPVSDGNGGYMGFFPASRSKVAEMLTLGLSPSGTGKATLSKLGIQKLGNITVAAMNAAIRAKPNLCTSYQNGIFVPGALVGALPCLGMGWGSVAPFNNFAASKYEQVSSLIGFLRGKLAQQAYKPAISYPYDYEKDYIMWISSNPAFQTKCKTAPAIIADGVYATGRGYREGLQMDDKNFSVSMSMPPIGVQWKQFNCCAIGSKDPLDVSGLSKNLLNKLIEKAPGPLKNLIKSKVGRK